MFFFLKYFRKNIILVWFNGISTLSGLSITKSCLTCIYIYIYIYMCVYICIYIYIYIYIYVTYTYASEIRNTDDTLLFRYETFIHFITFSLSIRGERHTIFTMLTVPTSPTVNSSGGLARPRFKSQQMPFSKVTKNPHSSLPGMTSFTPKSHFLYGVFIMTFVIVISSAHERELYSMCAPAPKRSRIVHSPTKPNDEI